MSAESTIERRLDELDRLLLGLLPRGERLAIVQQVEAKLKALGDGVATELVREAIPAQPVARTPRTVRPRSGMALTAGILGIVALVLLLATPFIYGLIVVLDGAVSESMQIAVLGTHVSAVALGGALAVVLGMVALIRLSRRRGAWIGHGWAITGLCTGPMPLLLGGLVAMIAIGQMATQTSTSPVVTATSVSPMPGSCSDGSCTPPSYSGYASAPYISPPPDSQTSLPVALPPVSPLQQTPAVAPAAATPATYSLPSAEVLAAGEKELAKPEPATEANAKPAAAETAKEEPKEETRY